MQASTPFLTKAAYSIEEFCELVSLGRSKAFGEIRSGRLRVVKAGRRSLITAQEVTAWLERLADRGAPAGAQA